VGHPGRGRVCGPTNPAAAVTAQPQLIVLDVIMPGLDGLGALRQLKENPVTKNIPVVVLSAKGHAPTKVEAEQAGAVLFPTRPFSPNQLLGEVKKISNNKPNEPPPQKIPGLDFCRPGANNQ